MTRLSNSNEGGSNGTTITVANSGGTSGDAWDAVNTAVPLPVYSTTGALDGSLGSSHSLSATSNALLDWSTSFSGFNATSIPWYTRDYFKITALPSAQVFLQSVQKISPFALVWSIFIDTTGHLGIRNRASGTNIATATTVLSLNTRHRYETKVVYDGTTYSLTLRCFYGTNADGITPDETLTGSITSANAVDLMGFGAQTAASATLGPIYHDNIAADTVDWIGPFRDIGTGSVNIHKFGLTGSSLGVGSVALRKMGLAGSGQEILSGTGTVALKKMSLAESFSPGVGSVALHKMGLSGTGRAKGIVDISPTAYWYTLDSSLRRAEIIEGYESFIWNERYSAAGDFQIVTRSTFENRRLLAPDTWIAKSDSAYIMKVDTISDDTADDGSRVITVTGKSIEILLDDRVGMPVLSDTTTTPNWVKTGTPGDIARSMFNDICVDTVLSALDTFPFLAPGLTSSLVPSYGVYWGAFPHLNDVDGREALIGGRRWRIIHSFHNWDNHIPQDDGAFSTDWDAGRLRLATWQPGQGTAGVTNISANPLTDIASGVHDALIDAQANRIKAFGYPIFLRFGHEMNGNWYTWDGLHNPTQFLTGDTRTFAASVGNWVGTGNCTGGWATSPAPPTGTSTHGFSMTSGAAGDMSAGHCSAGTIASNGMPCSGSDKISCIGWMQAGTAGRVCTPGAEFFNVSDVSLGTLYSSTSKTSKTGSAVQVAGTVTAPAGSTHCRFRMKVASCAAAGEVHYLFGPKIGLASTGPSNYIAAYQHVVDRFNALGVTNVTWVWCPSNTSWPQESWNDFSNYYPGSSYSNWVGIDGYNRGESFGDTWKTFDTVFNSSGGVYQTYTGAKPIMICETSSGENGGDKAAWITDMLASLKILTGIKALVWFDGLGEFGEFPIDSSASALAAYVAAGNDPYTAAFYYPGGNLSEPSDIITVTAPPDTLYATLKKLCDTYNLGFRFVRNEDAGEIYFQVYTGNDLTSDQSVHPAVIFDPNMESLDNVSQLTSTAIIKTVAYVIASNGYAVVYAPNADVTASGDGRRVLLVNSSNDGPAGSALTTALHQEGLIALAAQRTVYSFDGQLPQTVPYAYGRDYNLGDLVEERNSDGYGNQMLVIEQIFVSDVSGETAYPTLSVFQGITPGSWLSEGALEWSTINPVLTWDTV
jgi:Siphovirus ReqiPepy6 Gp37-like protein/Glycosyl hydrolase family 26